jgi:hypothetical protein
VPTDTPNDEEMLEAPANTVVSGTVNTWPTQVPTANSAADPQDTEMAKSVSDLITQESAHSVADLTGQGNPGAVTTELDTAMDLDDLTTTPLSPLLAGDMFTQLSTAIADHNAALPFPTNMLPIQHYSGYVAPAVNPFAKGFQLPESVAKPALFQSMVLKPLFSFSAPKAEEPEVPQVDIGFSKAPRKATDSLSTSSGSQGNGASSPDTEPSLPPANHTGLTLGVKPSMRTKRAPKRCDAVAKRDPDVA